MLSTLCLHLVQIYSLVVENTVERERQLPWPKKRGTKSGMCRGFLDYLDEHLVATQLLSGISLRKACAKDRKSE